jgi:transposase-like protein
MEAALADIEIIARVERRRKWTAQEKAALLAEVEAEGGKVRVVARRHRISESVSYNWRAARKAAATMIQAPVRLHHATRCNPSAYRSCPMYTEY